MKNRLFRSVAGALPALSLLLLAPTVKAQPWTTNTPNPATNNFWRTRSVP